MGGNDNLDDLAVRLLVMKERIDYQYCTGKIPFVVSVSRGRCAVPYVGYKDLA